MSGEELIINSAQTSPGAVLAQAREALGVTQREVSDALNLPITTIDAIESEDRERLPAHVFTRGYVRAYAKLLEVDPDPLVAAWAQDHHENPKPLVQASLSNTGAFTKQSLMRAVQSPLGMAGIAISVVVVIALIWALSGSEEVPEGSPPSADSDQIQTDQPVDASVSVSDSVSGSESESDTPASMPVDEPAESLTYESLVEEVAVEAQATVEMGGATVRRLTSSGTDRLSLQFVEECWVEIKDAEGNVLFGDLGQTGQRMDFVGSGPFRVLLGYAPGAELSFNAEPIALAPHTRNNVANLVLGQ